MPFFAKERTSQEQVSGIAVLDSSLKRTSIKIVKDASDSYFPVEEIT